MPGKLLDTNIIIRYIKGEGGLDDIFEEESLYFSSITLGELLFGAECSARKEADVAVYAGFCGELAEAKADSSTAPAYAKIKAQLKSDGHPSPKTIYGLPPARWRMGSRSLLRTSTFRL